MATPILDPFQSAVAKDLLLITNIAKEYEKNMESWIGFIRFVLIGKKDKLDPGSNEPVIFLPQQLLRIFLVPLEAYAPDLMTLIRQLEYDDKPKMLELYSRLDQLEIPKLSRADLKGLYLLVARAAEDNQVFYEEL